VQDKKFSGSVSVVIPCFRCAGTISRATDSVAVQTVRPLELILVDDASNDDTVATLQELQTKFGADWIRIIRLGSNSGPASARNAGWAAAHGDFIAFLDSDDAWHPRKLEIQSRFMSQHSEVVLSGHRSLQLAPGSNTPELIFELSSRKISYAQLLLANRFVTPSVMLKRTIPFRFAEGKRHMEDHLLWMQIAASGAKVIRLDAVLAFTFKPAYGDTGLSAALWAMEKAECNNYLELHRQRRLAAWAAWTLCCYSMMKFLKRLLVATGRVLVHPPRSV
jgi:glycosyltransferase involved in cell wall biosynthesis